MPQSWDSTSQVLRSPTTSGHRPSLSDLLSPAPSSPVSTGLLSPIACNRTSPYPVGPSCSSKNRASWERKSEYDGESHDDYSVSLPCRYNFPCHESTGSSYATGALRTPSATPEPRESDDYSRRSSISLAKDPIIEKLNCFRAVKKKRPLPPLEGLHGQELVDEANRVWATAQHTHDAPHQTLVTAQKAKRRRAMPQLVPPGRLTPSHCNVKYLIEELDHIRYSRVDLGNTWEEVSSRFKAQFPKDGLDREAGGLQGAYYRQHKALPLIRNNQLVFMENGHVEPIWKKIRERSDGKQNYALTHMYPDRAMNYPWLSLADREYAAKLNEERQIQFQRARSEAKARGTYIEKLPADEVCACCPGEDRKRAKGKDEPDDQHRDNLVDLGFEKDLFHLSNI
ncbi:hypothetical protein F5Y09DRAFT_334491 [Xylaria sp. FL1042]|nr:hypothetical protein F5Y09DRAFT_334491 [Xylaria sp. FL1042]